MMDEKTNKYNEFEEAIEADKRDGKYLLRLFVAGINPKSKRAIENLREVCEENLKGQYELEIIDIYQQPQFAKEGKIIAAPTLIKELPLPIRRFVGDLSDKQKLLLGLDVIKFKEIKSE
jgi:circadian clock protein KaiB